MNIRMLTILSAASLLVGFAARADEPTLTERIDNANADLMKAQAPIPHLELHNRGLEILRTIPAVPPVVAKDDDDAKAKAESCVAFKTTPMQYTTCK
jgi:hypothetical protein